jgi:hypothetical protein
VSGPVVAAVVTVAAADAGSGYLIGAVAAARWFHRHFTTQPVAGRIVILRDAGLPLPGWLMLAGLIVLTAAWPLTWPLNLYWARDAATDGPVI